MNVIAFLSQKGGSGKTTLSVHTAVAAEATGERVCVIDADPQESATAWASAREAGTPIVATAQAGELPVGERVRVRLDDVDVASGRIDFALVTD